MTNNKENKELLKIFNKTNRINPHPDILSEKEMCEDTGFNKILKILETVKKDVPINDLINILNNEMEYPEDLEKKLK